ncbi:L,D-transpeptidase [Acidithiobacillus concretivorus]|uniref:L,D-transpeptidase n=1 Tax=Acidithiobacillus concretivorus TaxID=3063952 RepID=A0ABS5ZUK6_9PROT|nr:L,D-transpeptidase [Acidithiobacillus concretivorus]MBU2739649.1 L,D-transpeptidase [Acidithiobacillus concretivorus]
MKKYCISLFLLLYLTVAAGSAQAVTTQPPTWLRVARVLAQLHYLPGQVGWTGLHTANPQIWWLWPPNTPPTLQKLTPDAPGSPLLFGALDFFAKVHGLPWSNQSSDWFDQGNRHRLYAAVLAARRRHREDAPKPFVWVYVRKGTPETLSIWRYNAEKNWSKWVLHSLTNTGVPGAITPNGTWAVYARFPSTRMTGCFPHGECYNDPDVRFVNYFWDGRAVHYFPRLAYGFRQSNGCVELPLKAAQRAYGLMHIGTPVTVMP